MVAPGVADVVHQICDLRVVELPIERGHCKTRWLILGRRNLGAGEYDLNHRVGVLGLNGRTSLERRKNLCEAFAVLHVAAGAVVGVKCRAAR